MLIIFAFIFLFIISRLYAKINDMNNLMIATNAVIPFIVYLLAGLICKKSGLVKEEFLKQLNSFVFRAFFPFIMFNNLYDVDFSTISKSFFVPFAMVMTIILIILAMIFVPIFEKEDSRKGVIIQAIFRGNTVIYAIPLVESVYGSVGAMKASILVAFVVPLYNIVSVAVLERYRGGKVPFTELLINIFKNPLIMGAIAGILFNLLPVTMPECLRSPIAQLSAMATPLSLIVLGGSLRMASLKKDRVPIILVTVIKLVMVPAVIVSIMKGLHFDPVELFVVFSAFATPVAAASYPMAQSMGGDADLAGEYVVVTTLTSLLTIFLWILYLTKV